MATYYVTVGTYQATWSTTTSTTNFSDGSAGDTSTSEGQSTGPSAGATQCNVTGFFDNGSSQKPSAVQFTFKNSSPAGDGTWIFEGSNDHSTWTTIQSASQNTAGGFATVNVSSANLTTAYEFYRLSVYSGSNDGVLKPSFAAFISDWRFTMSTATRRRGALIEWL